LCRWLKDFGYYDEQLHAWNIKTNIQTTVGAMILVGAVLGSIIAGPIGSNLGRKPGLIAIGVSAILGAILQVVYAHLALLLLGRLLQGGKRHQYMESCSTGVFADHLAVVAIGLASNFIPVYQSEVAPTKYRGIMVSLYQLGINIGGLIGTCINIGTHGMPSRWAYHIPLITSLVFPSILVIVTTFLPESPRQLIHHLRQ
jgi:MFS family permease